VGGPHAAHPRRIRAQWPGCAVTARSGTGLLRR
jgi:hypothetical protein